MAHEPDLDKAQREEVRWRILIALLYAGDSPWPTPETVILRALHDSALPVTAVDLRKQMRYLAGKNLITLHEEHTSIWQARLTPHGTDVTEHAVECPPGVGRPKIR